jgi:hypothetical protein
MAQAYRTLPPASELWELFDYRPFTGELIRKKAGPTRPDIIGKPAGSFNKNLGYWTVNIQNKNYYAHRVIWCWVTGLDPASFQIDHKNMNRFDNRWVNLRLATKAENMRNRLCRGTTYTKWGWKAQITINCKNIHLGYYTSESQAAEAYEKAAIQLHGEFCRVK